jgi:hypothetical protein
VLGCVDKRLQKAYAAQDFERAWLDCRRAGLVVRLQVALDEARRHAVAGKLGRGEYAGRTCADD